MYLGLNPGALETSTLPLGYQGAWFCLLIRKLVTKVCYPVLSGIVRLDMALEALRST